MESYTASSTSAEGSLRGYLQARAGKMHAIAIGAGQVPIVFALRQIMENKSALAVGDGFAANHRFAVNLDPEHDLGAANGRFFGRSVHHRASNGSAAGGRSRRQKAIQQNQSLGDHQNIFAVKGKTTLCVLLLACKQCLSGYHAAFSPDK